MTFVYLVLVCIEEKGLAISFPLTDEDQNVLPSQGKRRAGIFKRMGNAKGKEMNGYGGTSEMM